MDNEKFQELVLEQLMGLSKRLDRHDERFDRIDARLDKMDERFDKMDERFDKMDERFDKMDERFDKMDERLNSHDSQLETIARKVNLLDIGQEQIITQLSQIAKIQSETVNTMKVLVESDRLQNERISRLEIALR